MSTQSAINYCRKNWHRDPAGAITALRLVSPKTPVDELDVARELVVYAEWKHRIDRGLMPYHASTFDEMGFRYARAEFERYDNAAMAINNAVMDQTCLYFLDGGRETHHFAPFQSHVMGTVDFAPSDVDALPAGEPDLPHVIWMGCDDKYTVFAKPLMKSIATTGNGHVYMHLHVEPDHELGPIWQHAIRFIRLWEWMQVNDAPVWLLDVDALANRSPAELFPLLDGYDTAFRARPGRIEPWNQYNACVVGFNNTPSGKAYLARIAAFIQRAIDANNLRWGIDQVAMLCCLPRDGSTRVRLLDDRVVDYGYRDDGVIFCNSGVNKWEQLKPGYVDADRVAYTALLKRYL